MQLLQCLKNNLTASLYPRFRRVSSCTAIALPFLLLVHPLSVSAQTSVTNTATVSVPANAVDLVTANNSASDTDAVTPRTVVLTKAWVNAITGPSVTLTISGPGVNAAVTGSSSAPSTVNPATANAAVGSSVTVNEAFNDPNDALSHTVVLTCVRTSDGSSVTVSAGSFVMPGNSNVSCTFTNTYNPNPVLTLDKSAGTPSGNTAGSTIA